MARDFDAIDAILGDSAYLIELSEHDLTQRFELAADHLANSAFQLLAIDPKKALPINSMITRLQDAMHEFIRDYAPNDPRFLRGIRRGNGIWRNSDLLTPSEIKSSALYQDFLVKKNAAYQIGVISTLPDGNVFLSAFLAPESQGEYDRDTEALVTKIHRATQNILELRRENITLVSPEAAYDSRAIFLNSRGEVAHVGKQAEHSIAEGFIDISQNRIRAALPDDQPHIDRSLTTVLGQQIGDYSPIVCHIRNYHGMPGGSLTFHQLGPLSHADLFGDQARVVVIVRSDTPKPLPIDLLARAYGLRPAEADLLADLVAGFTLAEHAERRGTTTQTARTTLKLIFQKTPYNRQSTLIQAVSRAFDSYL